MPEADAQAIDGVESAFSLGGESALKDAYDVHGSLIYTFCRRFLGEDHAGSATRDVFVEAWRDRAQFDPSLASLGAWLMSIARGRVVDSLSRIRSDDRVGVDAGTESAVVQVGDRMLLADALGRLTGPSRTIVELAFVDGLTRGEIADRTSLPLATVTGEIDRGSVHLRRALVTASS
ncbi:MAG: sigma-70 family RNA polymerase sigma factor [Acidimicrobiia bacterium]|nr:sigma-70 family RNA polymerase sigma factor [Acidimicrobiia bacterium]